MKKRKNGENMAKRQMFAKNIIDSDMFLDMPLSAQALYFHLCMRADDEGFINNSKKISRMIGGSDDDVKLLITKKFLIPFDSGVVAIKHWHIHNCTRKDRFKETVYQDEKSLLKLENQLYETLDINCIQTVSKVDTQVIDKGGEKTDFKWYQSTFNSICTDLPSLTILSESRKEAIRRFKKLFSDEQFEEMCRKTASSDFLCGRGEGKTWRAGFDFMIRPSNATKILEGNYENQTSTQFNDGWDYIAAVARGEIS